MWFCICLYTGADDASASKRICGIAIGNGDGSPKSAAHGGDRAADPARSTDIEEEEKASWSDVATEPADSHHEDEADDEDSKSCCWALDDFHHRTQFPNTRPKWFLY